MTDIELVIKIPEEKYNMIRNKTYCAIYDVEVYEAITNGIPLPKGQISDWTPVEKELPKKGQHVLVSLDTEDVAEDYFAYSTEWFDSFINSEEKVIAWMPMPESYKQEVEE